MSLTDLASIGSCISGVSVLLSLVYLNLQVRQTERNQRAIIQQGRASRASDLILRIAGPELVQSQYKGAYGEDHLSLIELRQFQMIFTSMLHSFEDTFFHHRQKLIDEASFASTITTIRSLLSLPGYRVMWRQIRPMYEQSFVAFMDGIAEQATLVRPGDDLARWKAAILAEKANA
jgi:hypothetical protein